MRVDNVTLPTITEKVNQSSYAVQPLVDATDKALDAKNGPTFGLQNEQQIKVAIEQANKALEGVQRHFKYEVHEPTNQVVISVIDNNTNEVIGEIPSKKLLDAIANLWELAGLFVDERR